MKSKLVPVQPGQRLSQEPCWVPPVAGALWPGKLPWRDWMPTVRVCVVQGDIHGSGTQVTD